MVTTVSQINRTVSAQAPPSRVQTVAQTVRTVEAKREASRPKVVVTQAQIEQQKFIEERQQVKSQLESEIKYLESEWRRLFYDKNADPATISSYGRRIVAAKELLNIADKSDFTIAQANSYLKAVGERAVQENVASAFAVKQQAKQAQQVSQPQITQTAGGEFYNPKTGAVVSSSQDLTGQGFVRINTQQGLQLSGQTGFTQTPSGGFVRSDKGLSFSEILSPFQVSTEKQPEFIQRYEQKQQPNIVVTRSGDLLDTKTGIYYDPNTGLQRLEAGKGTTTDKFTDIRSASDVREYLQRKASEATTQTQREGYTNPYNVVKTTLSYGGIGAYDFVSGLKSLAVTGVTYSTPVLKAYESFTGQQTVYNPYELGSRTIKGIQEKGAEIGVKVAENPYGAVAYVGGQYAIGYGVQKGIQFLTTPKPVEVVNPYTGRVTKTIRPPVQYYQESYVSYIDEGEGLTVGKVKGVAYRPAPYQYQQTGFQRIKSFLTGKYNIPQTPVGKDTFFTISSTPDEAGLIFSKQSKVITEPTTFEIINNPLIEVQKKGSSYKTFYKIGGFTQKIDDVGAFKFDSAYRNQLLGGVYKSTDEVYFGIGEATKVGKETITSQGKIINVFTKGTKTTGEGVSVLSPLYETEQYKVLTTNVRTRNIQSAFPREVFAFDKQSGVTYVSKTPISRTATDFININKGLPPVVKGVQESPQVLSKLDELFTSTKPIIRQTGQIDLGFVIPKAGVAVKQESTVASFLVPRVKTEERQAGITGAVVSTTQKGRERQLGYVDVLQSPRQTTPIKEETRTIQNVFSVQRQRQPKIQMPRQAQQQAQQTQQTQRQQTAITNLVSPTTSTGRRVPLVKNPLEFGALPNRQKGETRREVYGGYLVSLRRYGQFQAPKSPVRGSLSRQQALAYGRSLAKGGLGASFMLVPTKKRRVRTNLPLTGFNEEFYKKKGAKDLFIQRREFRLGTTPERREIRVAKARKTSRKGITRFL